MLYGFLFYHIAFHTLAWKFWAGCESHSAMLHLKKLHMYIGITWRGIHVSAVFVAISVCFSE